MKKLFLAFALLTVVLAGLIAGAGFAFKATIEESARNTMLNLMGPGESSVQEVSFNPLTRAITASNWRSTYTSNQEKFQAVISRASGTISLRGLLSYLPLLDNLCFADEDFVPVIDNLTLSDCFWQGDSLSATASDLNIGTVSLAYSLARQYYTGVRPPFISSVNGFRADAVEIANLSVQETKHGRTKNSLLAKKVEIQELLGASAALIRLHGLLLTNRQKTNWAVDALTFTDVRISPELCSELVAYGQSPTGVIPTSLQNSLAANGRIFSQAAAENILYTEKGIALPVTITRCTLDWQEDPKAPLNMAFAGVRIPSSVLPPDLAPGLEGMPTVALDGSMQFTSQNPARLAFSAKMKDLADIGGDIVLRLDSLLCQDLSVTWKDHGLMARLARCVSPDPHLTSMGLNVAIMSLCANGSEKDREQCLRITSFVERPGTISIKLKKDRPRALCSLDDFLAHFGAFLEVSTTQGEKSLSEQSEAIFAKAKKSN